MQHIKSITVHIVTVIIAAWLVVCLPAKACAGGITTDACRLRAVVISRIAREVRWPRKDVSHITLGVIGNRTDACHEIFREVIKAMNRRGMDIEVRVIRCANAMSQQESQELSRMMQQCNIIFVGTDMREHYGSIIEMVRGQGVLTVAAEEEFCRKKGMLCLQVHRRRLRIMVNMDAVREEGIRISSEVLRHATVM